MNDISPLEKHTRRLLGLSRIIGDEPFGSAMLARAVRLLPDADAMFRDPFLAALADALQGSDPLCSVEAKRTGKRGQPGEGGAIASTRALAIAVEVAQRTGERLSKHESGGFEKQHAVLAEIAERYGISDSQAKADLAAGRKARKTNAELNAEFKERRDRRGLANSRIG